MRKPAFAIALVAAASLALAGCTGSAVVDGKRYSAYGLINEDANHNPTLHYHVSLWNVVIAVIGCETLLIPIVVVGWQLFVPDRKAVEMDPSIKGLEP